MATMRLSSAKFSPDIAEATSSSKVLGAAALGKKYVYLKTSGNYYMISFNGHVGYVHKDYAQIS